jgi:protein gp37
VSNIEWTGTTWNPTTGCTKISAGCRNCYAETMHKRLTLMGQPKYAEPFGRVRFHPDALGAPLRRKKPTTYFVNSMSDLFHKRLTNKQIASVFGVMAACPQHTFQVLTKRAERLPKWFSWIHDHCSAEEGVRPPAVAAFFANSRGADIDRWAPMESLLSAVPWPLPNVWLGVSVEDQKTADERIPLLLQAPAAVRFVSAEPLLGSVDLTRLDHPPYGALDSLRAGSWGWPGPDDFVNHSDISGLDWVIVGGESGPRARECSVGSVRRVVKQCRHAGVPLFVKQLGSNVWEVNRSHTHGGWNALPLKNSKGGDPSEWPEDLRVREMPGDTP